MIETFFNTFNNHLQVSIIANSTIASLSCKSLVTFQERETGLLLQLVSQRFFGLHGMLDREMFHATCAATPLPDKLQRKLHCVSTPLAWMSFQYPLQQTSYSGYYATLSLMHSAFIILLCTFHLEQMANMANLQLAVARPYFAATVNIHLHCDWMRHTRIMRSHFNFTECCIIYIFNIYFHAVSQYGKFPTHTKSVPLFLSTYNNHH
jgi:hypothetical protein